MANTLSLRAYCVDGNAPMANGLRALFAAKGVHSLRELHRTNLAASTVSWTGGGPPVTVIDDGGAQEKVTIVVLADGYAQQSQGAFVAEVERLFSELFTLDFYQANLQSFRVVRLGLVSKNDTLTRFVTRAHKSVYEVPSDTALGLAWDGSFSNAGFLPYSNEVFARVNKAVRVWRLDGDVVAVQANVASPEVWGKWSSRMMAMSPGLHGATVGHELGHCFGLADEYVGSGATATYTGSEPTEPNVTTTANRTTVKWKDLIAAATPIPTPIPAPAGWVSDRDIGLFEGAYRDYPKGIYRPSDNCRMREESERFCRVCAGVVADGLRAALSEGGRPGGGGAPGGSNLVSLTVRRQASGAGAVIGVAPARLAFPVGTPVPGLGAHVAWSGDQIVAAAPLSPVGTRSAGRSSVGLPSLADVYGWNFAPVTLSGSS